MRSYGQYCGVARALDVVGDRWTLLIVRELLLLGASRYTDLRNGLPGIATNLLVARLRELEEAGIIAREDAPPPIAATLYHLTDRGEELEPVIRALGLWGGPLMFEPAANDDAFRSHWLRQPLELHLTDRTPQAPPVIIEIRSGDEPMVVETLNGAIHTRPGSAQQPDAVLTGPPHLVIGTLMGRLSLGDARAAGVQYDGDPAILRRLRPLASQRDD
jgi:DNA-binding HxlR family transcriptional regulator